MIESSVSGPGEDDAQPGQALGTRCCADRLRLLPDPTKRALPGSRAWYAAL